MKTVTHILGIDIAKDKFDVNLRELATSEHRKAASFTNTAKGFKALLKWLPLQGSGPAELLHACMEATSRYGDALAKFLHEHKFQVSMVNPRRPRNYADSQFTRTVNDATDAAMIADFCAAQREELRLWEPLSPEHQQLRDLTRARDALVEERERFANMLETATGLARKTFLKHLGELQRRVRDIERAIEQLVKLYPSLKQQIALADSIPGVALITAATVIAELPPIEKVESAKAAVALFGLDPINKTSGKSVATKPRLSRMGSPRGRKALYMPALTALRCNPIIRDLGQRLRAKGRTGKYVVVAAMRKLLRLIYGVLKHGKAFDAGWGRQQRQPKEGALACA